jgi:hypothetical protein
VQVNGQRVAGRRAVEFATLVDGRGLERHIDLVLHRLDGSTYRLTLVADVRRRSPTVTRGGLHCRAPRGVSGWPPRGHQASKIGQGRRMACVASRALVSDTGSTTLRLRPQPAFTF